MRLWSNVGYLSGQNPLEGTARGDHALPPCGGAAFYGARAVRPWVGEQKPLGKTPLGGNPSPEMSYLPTSFRQKVSGLLSLVFVPCICF